MNTKRILALIICAVMLLTMIPVAALTIGAAEIQGDWTTYRSADEYETAGEGEEPIIYKPEAGYEYTSEGFTVVPADYKDTTPFLLKKIKEITGGSSLASNIQLVFNNVKTAARIAAKL